MADLNERVHLIEHWWRGNGTKGAEDRLQEIESKTASIANRINMMIIFLGILVIVSVPDLLKLLRLI